MRTRNSNRPTFPRGNDKDGNAVVKHVEGKYHYWDIATHEGVSEIQVFRNFQTALKTGGFTIDYANLPGQLVAHKGSTWLFIESKGTFYYQTIITAQEMQQEVTADASSLSDEIKKSGHVAVYGIHFDTGKAAILPDSERAQAVVTWLTAHGIPAGELTAKGFGPTQPVAANGTE